MKHALTLIMFAVSLFGLPAQAQETATTTTSTTVAAEEAAVISLARGQDGQYERGLVESVTTASQEVPSGGAQVQVYKIRLLSGPLEGQVRELRSDVGDNPYGLTPRQGDRVVIFMQPSGDGGWLLFLESFDRRGALIWLSILFVLTLVLLSGWQGLKTAFSVFVSILLIGGVLIPLFIQGLHPVPIAILLSGALTLLSTGLSTGWNRKSFVTAFGTMGGALVAYIVSLIFVDWAHLNGLATEEDRLFFQKNPNLDPRGLLFAGIIIAAAGVLEDVAVSIASGISEVRRMSPRASYRELFTSGMVIGKDHMSALANTLVFAYVGASLSSLLLYQQFGGSWLKFINFDSVADEIVRSLAGTIGLVFTVPITALLAAWAVRQGPLTETPDPHAGHKH
ncbi:YibE/F family protein [Candidatus Uhrbacteria bacterium]|nr:YibE/F family protein [Candidatus Uhrbacteria bacterium]